VVTWGFREGEGTEGCVVTWGVSSLEFSPGNVVYNILSADILLTGRSCKNTQSHTQATTHTKAHSRIRRPGELLALRRPAW
jgi:hypothetical protein